METHLRGSDGRRMFTAAFKQEQLAGLAREEPTLAELARELPISPSEVRRWHYLGATGSSAAVSADDDVVPASALRLAQARIKELERALGKKVMETEILQAARDEVKKPPSLRRVQAMTGSPMTVVRRTLGTSRAHRGLIQREVSNERWCSDVLEIACWNGEIVQLGFALDYHAVAPHSAVGYQPPHQYRGVQRVARLKC